MMSNHVERSIRKLEETATSLRRALSHGQDVFPCRIQAPATEAETRGYRSRCSFQIVASDDDDDGGAPRYAVRENGDVVVIVDDDFAIANWRIRRAMRELLTSLQPRPRQRQHPQPPQDADDAAARTLLTAHLTSVTFATSWDPSRTCLVTLHYDAPLPPAEQWRRAARRVVMTRHGWHELTGRSRGRVIRAFSATDDDDDDDGSFTEDTVYLQRRGHEWTVTLDGESLSSTLPVRNVEYVLSSTAFAHPNGSVMCQALAWMLNRIEGIVVLASADTTTDDKPTLLELYCGCGAHTMALLRSGLLDRIVAVESDQRLVRACHRNAELNQCQDVLDVVSQDAGVWSTRTAAAGAASVLLVDPPRRGLDERVCRMAMNNENLRHVLYISCGREALARDLQVLSPVFEVVDCVLLDLFPRCASVESLVHLRRRS